jgi:hypothetical protein
MESPFGRMANAAGMAEDKKHSIVVAGFGSRREFRGRILSAIYSLLLCADNTTGLVSSSSRLRALMMPKSVDAYLSKPSSVQSPGSFVLSRFFFFFYICLSFFAKIYGPFFSKLYIWRRGTAAGNWRRAPRR